jgi:hypothetical protein
MTSATLHAEFAELEQAALVEADRKFGDIHGDEHEWSDLEWDQYEHVRATVHKAFHQEPAQPETGAAA